MAVSRLRQDQIHTRGSLIDDTKLPSDHDANAADLEDTLDYLASQLADILGEINWYDAPDLSIAAINAKTFLDEKLALREYFLLTDITVPATQNYKVLSVAGSEVPARPKAINATTKGLVTAPHGGSFGTAHSLAEVAGDTTINPKNLLAVVDGSTGDPILDSSGKTIWGLLQHEAGATDGAVFTDTTPERAQVSFVVVNATNDDLVACAVGDIESKVVNLSFVDRNDLDSWVEQDFLRRGSFVDVPTGAQQVTLDNAIDNQGATPATQATQIYWRIDDDVGLHFQDSTGARDLLALLPAAAGDEMEVNVDLLDVNVGVSGIVDIDNGIRVDTGGQRINVGETPGQIDSTTLKLAATTGLAEVEGVGVTLDALAGAGGPLTADGTLLDADFSDTSHLDMRASDAAEKTLRVLAANDGAGASVLLLVSEDGDLKFQTVRETTPLPLDDSTAGTISGLAGGPHASIAAAIKYAIESGGVDLTFDIFLAASNYAQGVNIPGVTLDLTAYDEDMGTPASPGTPDLFLFLNGRLIRGASGTGIGDWYAGDTPASGDIKVDFPKGIKTGDLIITIGLKQ